MIRRFIKCICGFGSLPDICWFSKKYWDIHDYYVDTGGDGTPTHFHSYTCHSCGKEFII